MVEQDFDSSYSFNFFDQLRSGSKQSAQVIVPLILNWVNAQSVVDVGCGDGTWLSVFQSHGVNDLLGLDGSYVTEEILQIPLEYFSPRDLSQPFFLDRTFDLVVSLEVAEHLPKASAQGFVESLTRLGNVVLFSAAIPHQGGTNHINEQWPEYWIKLFENQGYVVVDSLRNLVWDNPEIQPWYAQNSFLFVQEAQLKKYPVIQSQIAQTRKTQRSIVHPTIYLQKCPEAWLEPQSDSDEPELTQMIQIVGVTLSPSAEIQCGEGLTIHIQYQLNASVETAIFNLSLSDEAGQIYIDTETDVTTLPSDLTVSHSVQLHIERLDLVQGNYFVNPGIFSADWSQTHDFRWHCYPLILHSPFANKGILNPLTTWLVPDTSTGNE